MRNSFSCWCILAFSLLLGAPCAAFAQDSAAQGFTFEPHSAHWVVENCEAEFAWPKVIRGAKGNGWVRLVHPQRDFQLELDWKPEKAGFYDGGLFFRADAAPEGKSWPDFFQINLKTGAEAVLKNTPTDSSSAARITAGDWNHLKLTVAGAAAVCEVNDQVVWKSSRVAAPNGFLALQVEEPKGGVVLYRNVKLTEFGFRRLLGEGLKGWQASEGNAADCWVRESDELICTGAKGPWLRYGEGVSDFNLRLDYRLKEGGNSGVYVRVPKEGNHHGPGAGIEVQILDDAAPRYASLKPYQYSGSLYAIVPADPRVTRKAPLWNTLEIDCQADRYVVWQNGKEVLRATGATAPELLERNQKGFLGLQNHSEEVRFRNIRLGPSQQTPLQARVQENPESRRE